MTRAGLQIAVGVILVTLGATVAVATDAGRDEPGALQALLFGPILLGLALLLHALARLPGAPGPRPVLHRGARVALPIAAGLVLLTVWWLLCALGAFPPGTVPWPGEVAAAFRAELASGRLVEDTIASLYRVAWGFVTAVVLAVPLGLVIGRHAATRATILPWVNFFRSLSPIAWIPFAIIWFGVGDPPSIFIIFLATFFQVVLATAGAAAAVPRGDYRVAEELGLRGHHVLFHITLPAILPQLVTALRIAIGVAWMVVVAAEMIAVRSGLGFLIIDARNGLRMDLVVCGMITIGTIGIVLDLVFSRLAHIPSLRWGFER